MPGVSSADSELGPPWRDRAQNLRQAVVHARTRSAAKVAAEPRAAETTK
jgi:hypothetical protein